MTTLRNLSLLLLICSSYLLKAQNNSSTGYDFVVSEDGVWTWYNDERAIVKNDRLYTSYVKRFGRVGLSVNNLKTGAPIGSEVILSDWSQRDDHNNAALLGRQDGKIMAFFSPHIREKQNYYRTSLVNEPTQQSDWSAQFTQITTNDSDSKGATYNNAFQLSAEGGKIYNFMRTNNFNPNVKQYDASGTPLRNGKDFILFKNGDGSVRPYVKYTSNNTDRIDFFFTDGHPRNANNSLYHCYYKTNADGSEGDIYQTDGTFIATLQSVFNGTPIDVSQVNKIYVFGSDGTAARAWTHNMNYDANGNPVVTYSKQLDFNRITYHYARWTGSQWENHFVSDAGRGLYNGEQDYTGIITTNPYDTNEIFMSSNRNPITGVEDLRWEIYSAITADGGNTWSWTEVTKNSAQDNLRPYLPKGITNPDDRVVLWFYGEYVSYFDYTTKVVAKYINRAGNTTPSIPPVNEGITYKIDINTATSASKAGFTGLVAANNASVTNQGATFTLTSSGAIGSRNRSGAANSLVSDFAFGSPENPGVNLTLSVSNLEAGRYRFESYHHDNNYHAPVSVRIKAAGEASLDTKTVNNTISPATFEIDVKAGKVYEVTATENGNANRVRFNGLVVTQLEPATPTVIDCTAAPSNFVVASATDTSITISYDNNGDNTRSGFELRAFADGAFQGNINDPSLGYAFAGAGSNTITMNNLTAGTTYDLVLRALCSGQNPGSSPAIKISGTTSGGSTPPGNTSYLLDINTASNNTKQGYTGLVGTNGSSTTINNNTTFSLFGFNRQPGTTTVSDQVLGDFAANSSTNPSATPAIGLRITGLAAGTYNVKSYHYDPAVASSNIKVQVRNAGYGNPQTTLQSGVSLGSMDAVSYQFTVVAGQDYDLIFRSDGGTVSRLNGIEITPAVAAKSVNKVLAIDSGIKAYPNPFSEMITIKVDKKTQGLKAVLFDLTARKIVEQHNGNSGNFIQLMTNTIPAGVYTLIISDNEGIITRKTMIRK